MSNDMELHAVTVESLKLIVQSQMILADLQANQSRLEELIRTLKEGVTPDEP